MSFICQEPWHFTENSVFIGHRCVLLGGHVLDALVTFDMFLTSSLKSASLANPRLGSYYLDLRLQITEELKATPEGKAVELYPQQMVVWLWRTSLGYFDHTDFDNEEINAFPHGGNMFNTSFPDECKSVVRSHRLWFSGVRRQFGSRTLTYGRRGRSTGEIK
jgi:hypothetical protein